MLLQNSLCLSANTRLQEVTKQSFFRYKHVIATGTMVKLDQVKSVFVYMYQKSVMIKIDFSTTGTFKMFCVSR